jgi:hypothetical protein
MSGLHLFSEKSARAGRLSLWCHAAALLLAAAKALPAQGLGILLVERFDTVVPPALPAGWTSSRNRNPLQDDFISTASGAQSPPQALLSTNATISQDLISPAVSFLNRSPGNLSFSLRRSPTHRANLLLEASTDDGANFGVVVGDTPKATGVADYQTVTLSLPSLLRGLSAVRFRWRTVADNAGANGTLRIDDVIVTADVEHDVAISGAACTPPAARESSTVLAVVQVAGIGREPLVDAQILLGVDADGSGGLSGGEIWTRSVLSSPPARGETAIVAMTFQCPAAGEYRLMLQVDSPTDEIAENNVFVVPFAVGFRMGTVVINEIMYAPVGGEPEWIELLNTSTSSISLKRWRVGDAAAPEGKDICTTAVMLPPGGIVVVTRSANALAEIRQGCGTGCIEMEGLPSLNNGGDAVVLRDMAGYTLDSVYYLPAMGGSAGSSLERRDELGAGDDRTNWGSCTAATGATPCALNSIAVLDTDLALVGCWAETITAGERAKLRAVVRNVGRATIGIAALALVEVQSELQQGGGEMRISEQTMGSALRRGDSSEETLVWESPRGGLHHLLFRIMTPGDHRTANDTLSLWVSVRYRDPFLRINEIMAVPWQGEAEYVEIMNAGRDTIDLAGWSLESPGPTGARQFVLSRRTLVLLPGALFVLASDSSLFRRFGICDSHCVAVAGTSSLQLNNDADVMVLRDAARRTVDSVAYESRWHSPVLIDPAGRSLERISPGLPSMDARSWGTSVAPMGGTPGCPNSISTSLAGSSPHLAASPNPFSPDGDGRDDHTIIHFQTSRPSSWMSLKIYDVRGRLIRFLANNEPCGGTGDVVWDGFDDRRCRARIGIYIILLEVVDEDRETVLTAKGSVVVAGKLR